MQAAEAMGCSQGTVKSAASRGMQRLRELASHMDTDIAPHPAWRT
jgi:DNA-directed RNA polymerase specialized sigma24 family protein